MENQERDFSSLFIIVKSEQIIESMCRWIVKSIPTEIRSVHYYVDETPDISNSEHFVFFTRYNLCQDRKWKAHERFLKLLASENKTGEGIADQVKNILKDCPFDLSLCRGQGYDNSSNMSRKFQGVKARVLKECLQAYFTHYSMHTLFFFVEHMQWEQMLK